LQVHELRVRYIGRELFSSQETVGYISYVKLFRFFLIINQVQNAATAIYSYLYLNWLC